MSQAKPVPVTILDKEYLISCREGEEEQLQDAANYVDEKMRKMRNSGSVIGAEQTAVIAALNIANEMFAYKQENKDYTSEVGSVVGRLHQKVNEALTQGSQVETAGD